GLRTAALTNNWAHDNERDALHTLHDALAFDVVVESAREGLRKPDSRIYALVLARLDVVGTEAVFLDDLGINLKPARAMGMTTIKVTDPDAALAELEAVLGSGLRQGMARAGVRRGDRAPRARGGGVPADPGLTPLGREQAQRLADWLAHEKVDVILSSPKRRAQETAAPLADTLGL